MTNKKSEPKKDIVSDLVAAIYNLLAIENEQNDTPIYSHEVWFTIPAVKKSLSLYAAIQRELDCKALVASAVLLRSLIETISNYCFVIGLPKGDGFYEKYLETGRLRVHRNGKGWQKVTVAQQIGYTEKAVGITKLQEAYDNCSDLVHPSADNIKLVFTEDKGEGVVKMKLSADEEHIDESIFNDIRVTTMALMVSLYRCLLSEIDAKSKNVTQAALSGYHINKIEPF